MRKLILVKYAPEIFLKGLNKGKFERKLMNNIKNVMKGVEYDFVKDEGRWFIECENIDEGVNRMKKVFGISEVCIAYEISRDMESIKKQALTCALKCIGNTFKVVTKRADKKFPINSMEVSRLIGAYILENTKNISVDVKKPDFLVNIEIRDNAYVYSERIKAEGGMPYGTNGSTMLMLSGGIDSPVAGYMMARRGVILNCVYFHSHPYTSERAKEKVKDLANILKSYTGSINLFVAPFTEIQMQIIEKCREDELTIIMRRFMMRIACKLAEKYDVDSVTTGESIGQVASQTMAGLVVSNDTADRPVFRPLIAMDKVDIMDAARKIGTYNTSILPYEDCCTIFVPKHPKTKPRLEEIKKAESILDIDELVKKSIDNTELFN
ncbi:tRNA 4-thiouridine(8) synthase ThiI [Clostridium tyrobutyricum]|jgi:thiamine biosynthesis protein ThiI|uniref:Probable tRNA sulfurtransferase n=2 Tax=Clostridium tyrobutyricum TaxID=1519 RepID=W6N3E0_CLOTY|nr:tRNA uracil 4-sulfurtransferase ThiI [Clostridium tyrobutyricum]AND84462.1 tRNA sulfurtransferase [Clostridium tyrobutyricum]ANP69077.1 tRNA 4-thiouridine(8) synthase ThiI [Clostridium tyrobutyricum]MBR9647572.1 tRNA 4-thiouridine(8) synthase ThiI [Clostridium tyrobutyricum]MBV4416744.1 tRNA 4-thiouridine(8) synthase ThiI [Clostridium tyrobutyricum]MBV4422764.1 tRNA 4-thiouridine(8) synthase ThiI [Clostridium tyrobutyricum]